MALNPTGASNHGWNYTKPDQPNYTQSLVGTVVAIQEVQKRAFTGNGTPGAPEFWPEGKPKMNQRIALAIPTGELVTFTYQPASSKQKKDDRGIHMALFNLTGKSDMNALIGKTIQLDTWDMVGANGQIIKYGSGNPRPFTVHEVINGEIVTFGDQGDPHVVNTDVLTSGPYVLTNPLPYEYTVPELLADNAASGGQYAQPQPAAPQAIQVPQVPQATPVAAVPNPVAAPAVAPAPVMQAAVQPMMPAGMEPQVAQAMQTLGATNVQPVVDASNPYDENIPF